MNGNTGGNPGNTGTPTAAGKVVRRARLGEAVAERTNPWGPWGEPAVAISYGPSGSGKTTDLLYAVAGRALFLVMPGALKPSIGVLGYPIPDAHIVRIVGIDEAITLIQQVAASQSGLPWHQRYLAIVIDDLSLLARNELARMKQSGRYNRGSGFDWSIWGDLGDKIDTLCHVARYTAGCHVLANAHERAGETKNSEWYPGGPELPSIKMVKRVPHIADTVVRWRREAARKPWGAVFQCNHDTQWLMKDRHGHSGTMPGNIAELLRHSGYYLPRAPGLEWQDEWVDIVAQSLIAGRSRDSVKRVFIEKLTAAGRNPLHIRWAWRDGVDRAAFVQREKALLADM